MSTPSALKLLTTATGTAGLYLLYDYKTCHPMRKIKYDPQEALIRLHNTLIRQLLPTMWMSNEMTLEELSYFDGSSSRGKPIYFSAAGTVYDASTSAMFQSTYHQWAGKDATVALAKMSLDKPRYQSDRSLERFERKRTNIAAIVDRLFR